VWLGWFLCATLKRFAPLCILMDDEGQSNSYRQQAEELRQALEANAWDGQWYLRAFYDDGAPLGTAQDTECQISSIAQAWAVLSGAADPARAALAMEAVAQRLVDDQAELMLLFAPPFDKTPRDPGYVKGYPPGVRENGGQYTHGVLWTVWAFAQLGQGDRAERLFRLLNPIHHGADPEHVDRYRVEPYVVPADVSGVAPHAGRGGWTWYTGSAGWMYRLGLEAILGLSRQGETLHIAPCIPKHWPGYEIRYQYGETSYRISVRNPQGVNQGVKRVVLDGEVLPTADVPLLRDGQAHQVQVEMG
jgi:cellobiose phosphorylase